MSLNELQLVMGIRIRFHISGGLVFVLIFIKHFLSVLKISKTFLSVLKISKTFYQVNIQRNIDKDPFSKRILENGS